MSSPQTLEQRLTAVEQELAEIKRRIEEQDQGVSWIERIAGTFRDDSEFDEVVRLGREFRNSIP